jgi:hypothetical protein
MGQALFSLSWKSIARDLVYCQLWIICIIFTLLGNGG